MWWCLKLISASSIGVAWTSSCGKRQSERKKEWSDSHSWTNVWSCMWFFRSWIGEKFFKMSKQQKTMTQPIVSSCWSSVPKLTRSRLDGWNAEPDLQVSSKREKCTSFERQSLTWRQKSRIQIWLYENADLCIEGQIIVSADSVEMLFLFLWCWMQGFDEYMNLVLDNAEEYHKKKGTRKPLGKILLKGENITLMQVVDGSTSSAWQGLWTFEISSIGMCMDSLVSVILILG